MSTPKKPAKKATKSSSKLGPLKALYSWIRASLIRQIITVILAIIFLIVSTSYGIAVWYIQSNADKPLTVGATFTSDYARYFDLDPKETMTAMADDLGIKHFRLVSYWDHIEKEPGNYDFSELDWQFELAEDRGAKVSLAIGLRQPRWPECHMPKWAEVMPMTEWEPALNAFMKKVIERYKDSPALESYQLENEFFLSVFGICPDFTRERLIREYNFVKSLDPDTKLIISRSNNAIGYPVGEPRPDMFAVSVYKRVWDKTITKRYLEYPFPAWFYGTLAGGGKILTGKDMMIHELQTEAWLPDTGEFKMNDIKSIPEQNKSLNDKRLVDRIRYGEASGMKRMDLWGAEWWYWRKVKAGDPSLWDTAKSEIKRIEADNATKTSN